MPSPRGSLTTLITTPLGPLVVYGTVLPWANEPGGDGVVRMWREHYAEITRQGAEWAELAADDPARALCVAGDFNQNLDGGRWYGTHEGRRLLLAALQGADLVCCTSSDMVTEGQLRTHHLIDHICLSRSWLQRHSVTVRCWEPVNADGTRMSDHPGVAVDVCPA